MEFDPCVCSCCVCCCSRLSIPILSGHYEVVLRLLDGGADPKFADQDGWTALMFASRSGNLEMTRLLLDRGADVAAVNNAGFTALSQASINQHPEVVSLLQARATDDSMVAEPSGDAAATAAGAALDSALDQALRKVRFSGAEEAQHGALQAEQRRAVAAETAQRELQTELGQLRTQLEDARARLAAQSTLCAELEQTRAQLADQAKQLQRKDRTISELEHRLTTASRAAATIKDSNRRKPVALPGGGHAANSQENQSRSGRSTPKASARSGEKPVKNMVKLWTDRGAGAHKQGRAPPAR